MRVCTRCKVERPEEEFRLGKARCRTCERAQCREWKAKHKKEVAEYNKAYKTRHKKELAKRRKNRRDEENQKYNQRYWADPQFRKSVLIRGNLRALLRKNKEPARGFIKYVGCSLAELRNYLERLFLDGMSWENYGEWHIDHVRPLSSFDLTDIEQYAKATHYLNLQPLWAKDNYEKYDKEE